MTSWVPFDLLDHLWQSTLFAAAVWLVARALRTNAARVRYWLWFAASLKFLVPLALLVSVGEQFAWRTTPAAAPAVASVIEQVLTPAATTVATTSAPVTSSSTVWPVLLLVAWGAGVLLVLAQWWRQWRPIGRALRDARAIDIGQHAGLTVLTSASMIEPGVLGIWRPVLLVPDGIRDRLTPAQFRALIAHERCHVEHHDNLTATLHMAIEAVFWFHPLVWWLERRLIEERERACDEYVLQSGSMPRDYAEGILEVCRFAKDPSPVFVAGVTGSDLRRRIESILRDQIGRPLSAQRTAALLVCAAAAVLGPVTAGAVQSTKPVQLIDTAGQEPGAPVAFEVAAVRLNRSGQVAAQIDDLPGGRFIATNATVRMLILEAYRVPDKQLGESPDWTRTERFDVNAKLEREAPIVRGEAGQRQLALRSLLAERFKLVVHRETRQVPMYALVMARADRKPGPMLRPSSTDCSTAGMQARTDAAQAGKALSGICGTIARAGRIQFGGPLSAFARALSGSVDIGRNVIDRTGMPGAWDFELTFTPDRPQQRPPGQEPVAVDPNGPSLLTALQEQLGLKLESIQGPMEFLIVDRVERLDRQDAIDPRP